MAKKTRTIGVIVSEELFEKVRYCASVEMENHSMSGMIVRLLEAHVEGKHIDPDLAKALVRMEKKGRGCMTREQRLEKEHRISWVLPYGVWTCADGRQFLFNWHHCPIFERASESSPAVPVNAWAWVPKVKEELFWKNQKLAPWLDRTSLIRCQDVLHQWGVVTRQDGSVYDLRARGGLPEEYVFEAF